jgi:hypothetical protein
MTELNTNKNAATWRQTVALIDALKERRGSRDRSQVMQLIEQRRPAAQKR